MQRSVIWGHMPRLPLRPIRALLALRAGPVPRPALSVTRPVGVKTATALLGDGAAPRGWRAYPLDTSTLLRNDPGRCVARQSAVDSMIGIARFVC